MDLVLEAMPHRRRRRRSRKEPLHSCRWKVGALDLLSQLWRLSSSEKWGHKSFTPHLVSLGIVSHLVFTTLPSDIQFKYTPSLTAENSPSGIRPRRAGARVSFDMVGVGFETFKRQDPPRLTGERAHVVRCQSRSCATDSIDATRAQTIFHAHKL